jgi:hypothetical protein
MTSPQRRRRSGGRTSGPSGEGQLMRMTSKERKWWHCKFLWAHLRLENYENLSVGSSSGRLIGWSYRFQPMDPVFGGDIFVHSWTWCWGKCSLFCTNASLIFRDFRFVARLGLLIPYFCAQPLHFVVALVLFVFVPRRSSGKVFRRACDLAGYLFLPGEPRTLTLEWREVKV